MPRPQDVFYNLVTNENSTTQLLSNLLQFDDFRAVFLGLILPGVVPSEVVWGDIDTQIAYDNCGLSDIRIRNKSVLAPIEVKVGRHTDCTENQPKGYIVSFALSMSRYDDWSFLCHPTGSNLTYLSGNCNRLSRSGRMGGE